MILWEFRPAAKSMAIFSSQRIFHVSKEVPYAQPILIEARRLPNSDTFDILSKCFRADSRSAGMSRPSLQKIAAFSAAFCSSPLESSEHSNSDGVIILKTAVPSPAASSAKPLARSWNIVNGEYKLLKTRECNIL